MCANLKCTQSSDSMFQAEGLILGLASTLQSKHNAEVSTFVRNLQLEILHVQWSAQCKSTQGIRSHPALRQLPQWCLGTGLVPEILHMQWSAQHKSTLCIRSHPTLVQLPQWCLGTGPVSDPNLVCYSHDRGRTSTEHDQLTGTTTFTKNPHEDGWEGYKGHIISDQRST